MSIKFCKKCLFPETKPDLYFNDEGICDSCISATRIHGISNSIDWNERKKNFESIVKEYRGGDKYNCIVFHEIPCTSICLHEIYVNLSPYIYI